MGHEKKTKKKQELNYAVGMSCIAVKGVMLRYSNGSAKEEN